VSIVHRNCRLAYGATRAVLLIGGLAVKIPRPTEWRLFLLGLLANMQERQFARTGWPELCPVLFSLPGGWLVVMPRASILTDEEWDRIAYADIYSFANQQEYAIPVELKSDSFGWLNGRLVAVDYGN